MEVVVKVDGLDESVRTLADARTRLSNLEPPLKGPAERFKSLIDRSFQDSASPDGKGWDRLSDARAAWKKDHGFSPKPLVMHGARGLQGQTTARAEKDGISIGFGPNTPYGLYHQFGTKKMPRRAFLPFSGTFAKPVLMGGQRVQAIVEDLKARVVLWIREGKLGRG